MSFLNLGGLANAATSAAGALGGAVGGMAGAGQSKLLPEPKVPQLNVGPMFLGWLGHVAQNVNNSINGRVSIVSSIVSIVIIEILATIVIIVLHACAYLRQKLHESVSSSCWR